MEDYLLPNERVVNALKTIKDTVELRPINKITPFEQLVATILSQNTNWRNVDTALKNLKNEDGITVDHILRLGPEKLSKKIKSSGLHKVKSKKIYQTALILKKEYSGNVESIIRLPVKKARAILMALPGVGPKTADVLLAFSGGRSILPVDTHITRVSKRLQLVGEKNGYEEIRSKLESYIPPGYRVKMHIAIIEFGKSICKAINPRCLECPVKVLCPSKHLYIKPRRHIS